MAGTHANPSRSEEVYGIALGFARLESGEPVAEGRLIPVPDSPPPVGLEEILFLTQPDGSYRLMLPAETYTIQVLANSPSGAPFYGEATGVVVIASQETRADIVVTEQPAGWGEELPIRPSGRLSRRKSTAR